MLRLNLDAYRGVKLRSVVPNMFKTQKMRADRAGAQNPPRFTYALHRW